MIFVLQHLSSCQNYLNTYQVKVESEKKLSLHRDKKAKFTTYVYCKPTSIGIFTHFETFFTIYHQNWCDLQITLKMFSDLVRLD